MTVRSSPCGGGGTTKFAFLCPGGVTGKKILYMKGTTVKAAAEKLHQLMKVEWCIPLDFNTKKQNGPKIIFS